MTLGMNGLSLSIYWLGAALINSLSDAAARLSMFSQVMVFSTYAVYVVMSFMMLVMIYMMLPQAQVSAERIMEVLARERLSRPLTDAACFAIFRDEFIGDDALIFLCGAISVAATDIV